MRGKAQISKTIMTREKLVPLNILVFKNLNLLFQLFANKTQQPRPKEILTSHNKGNLQWNSPFIAFSKQSAHKAIRLRKQETVIWCTITTGRTIRSHMSSNKVQVLMLISRVPLRMPYRDTVYQSRRIQHRNLAYKVSLEPCKILRNNKSTWQDKITPQLLDSTMKLHHPARTARMKMNRFLC